MTELATPTTGSLGTRLFSVEEPVNAESAGNGLFVHITLLLCGRWKWAIGLGVLLGLAAGAAGWRLGNRSYISRGQVHVAAYIDDYGFSYGVDRSLRSQNYDSLMETQMQFIKTMRVIDKAMDSEGWRGLGRPTTSQKVQEFVNNLQVSRKGEIIFVEMRDTNSVAATAGVHSVIEAYKQLNDEEDSQRDKNKVEFLQAELARSINRVSQIDTTIRGKLHDLQGYENFGIDDLEQLFAAKLTEAGNYDGRLQEVRRELSIRNLAGSTAGPATRQVDSPAPHANSLPLMVATGGNPATQPAINVEEIAMENAQMASFLSQRHQMEEEYARIRSKYGDGYPLVQSMQRDHLALDERIEEFARYYAAWRANQKADGKEAVESARLQKLETSLVQSSADARQSLENITKLKRDIQELHDQAERERLNRNDIKKRIETEEGLARVPGHIRVLDFGDKPLAASGDTRPVFASFGALSGLAAGLGMMVMLGLLDRGVRGPGDTDVLGIGKRPVLGLLPQLPTDPTDPEQTAQAAHCVHQVRTMLQLWYGGMKCPVLAISGAEAGAGKTTLTLALGVSFAAAQSKTLLIDFDWVGGGLTSRVNLTRRYKIGQILLRQGVIREQDLEEALCAAGACRSLLGQALVRLGFVREADLEIALARQQRTSLGVLDALDGVPLCDCVIESSIPNLSILGLGEAGLSQSGRVSPLSVQRLVEAARSQFEIVLIDTGPLPGSLEGSAVVAVADGTILTISRGNSRTRVRQCVEHLRRVDARLAGVVFNRATAAELLRAGTNASSGFSRQTNVSPKTNRSRDFFGPFGTAVTQAAAGKRANEQ